MTDAVPSENGTRGDAFYSLGRPRSAARMSAFAMAEGGAAAPPGDEGDEYGEFGFGGRAHQLT